jgi:hypothetical protein
MEGADNANWRAARQNANVPTFDQVYSILGRRDTTIQSITVAEKLLDNLPVP